MILEVFPQKDFYIEIDKIAPDKSISHRCAIFSLLSDEESCVKNYLLGEDTLNSLEIAKRLGLSVKKEGDFLIFIPPKQILEPKQILDCGNAGTAIRLYAGLLSAQKGMFILSGDSYLNNRPMKRVVEPLRNIGAEIYGREGGNLAPLVIFGKDNLESFSYESKIASAQVKSAMILSALFAKDISFYKEPELSRDHTEKMLCGMGANLESKKENSQNIVKISPLKGKLRPLEIEIPADPSSAFFFALALVISPNSKGVLKNVLLNKTRIEAFRILEKMGAKINYIEKTKKYESIGDIEIIAPSELKAVSVSENISWLIDEIPALAIAFACAKGESRIHNAKELRVKETDRIKAVVENLRLCGIEAIEFEDGFAIKGGEFKKAEVDSFGDHRIAMSFAIAGLKKGMRIKNAEYINISFPNFLDILSEITQIKKD